MRALNGTLPAVTLEPVEAHQQRLNSAVALFVRDPGRGLVHTTNEFDEGRPGGVSFPRVDVRPAAP